MARPVPAPTTTTADAAESAGAIDVHAHLLPLGAVRAFGRPDLIEALGTDPDGAVRLRLRGQPRRMPRALTDVGEHLRDMDRRGLAVRYLAPPPFTFFYDLPAADALAWTRTMNDAMIDAVAGAPERLRPVGILPMAYPGAAAVELARLARRGVTLVELGTHVLGAGLHEARFRPVLRAAAEHGVALLLHPDDVGGRYAEERWHLRNLVGNPFETTYTAVQLAAAGVLDELPGLRICLSHGGGALPQLLGRIDHAAEVRPDVPLPPSRAWTPRFYYDSIVFSDAALDALVATVGAARVCYGTDAPFDMSDPLAPAERFARYPVPDRRQMTRDAALALLAGTAPRTLALEEDA